MSGVKQCKIKDKIWNDHRGWGVSPLEIAGLLGKPLGDLHVVSIKPDAIRGNHYHTDGTEWLLVFGGEAKVAWRDSDKSEIHEVTTDSEEPVLFEISPGTAHAVKNISSHDIFLISFRDATKSETVRGLSLLD